MLSLCEIYFIYPQIQLSNYKIGNVSYIKQLESLTTLISTNYCDKGTDGSNFFFCLCFVTLDFLIFRCHFGMLNFTIHNSQQCILLTEAAVRRCSVKKVFLKMSRNSQKNTSDRSIFFNKVAGLGPKHIYIYN